MKYVRFSHNNGVNAVPQQEQANVTDAITATEIRPHKGGANDIRDGIISRLRADGWSAEISVSMHSKITITSTKNKIGLCFQTGNMARMYADLLKLQALFVDGSIRAAVMIVASQKTARVLGSNITNSKRLETELSIFKTVITVPIALYSFE